MIKIRPHYDMEILEFTHDPDSFNETTKPDLGFPIEFRGNKAYLKVTPLRVVRLCAGDSVTICKHSGDTQSQHHTVLVAKDRFVEYLKKHMTCREITGVKHFVFTPEKSVRLLPRMYALNVGQPEDTERVYTVNRGEAEFVAGETGIQLTEQALPEVVRKIAKSEFLIWIEGEDRMFRTRRWVLSRYMTPLRSHAVGSLQIASQDTISLLKLVKSTGDYRRFEGKSGITKSIQITVSQDTAARNLTCVLNSDVFSLKPKIYGAVSLSSPQDLTNFAKCRNYSISVEKNNEEIDIYHVFNKNGTCIVMPLIAGMILYTKDLFFVVPLSDLYRLPFETFYDFSSHAKLNFREGKEAKENGEV